MKIQKQLSTFLPKEICELIKTIGVNEEDIQEIRMNTGQPLILKVQGKELFPTPSKRSAEKQQEGFLISESMLRETFEFVCRHSVYAYEEEIRQGFITIEGGHRVGLAGQAVVEKEKVRNLKYISGLNIRIASEVKGCAQKVIKSIANRQEIYNTLIVSPPCSGKTTLLRDCIRMISNGFGEVPGVRVGVVDERGEIGAAFHGIPQNDLGIRTDILDRMPKAEGILMLIRSMAPRVVAVDEIGSASDMEALKNACFSGCNILATIHGASPYEIYEKTIFENIKANNMFQRYIVLKPGKMGEVKGIYDENFQKIS